MNEAHAWLAGLFAADTNAPDFYARFPLYAEVALKLPGLRPYWPALSECWACGPTPPATWPAVNARGWLEASEYLAQLRAEYEAAKAGG